MIEFGNTLKAAREAKGLAIADIAAQTHMMSSMIADLEKEDFSRLPAPIYGRGFVKLYCEAVGLDPAPMVAEFMEIFNGNREPAIRERAVPPPSEAPAATEPKTEEIRDEPAPVEAPEPPSNGQLDLFNAPEKPFCPAAVPPPPPAPPPTVHPTEPAAGDGHAFAKYAMPLHEYAQEAKHFLPAAGRILILTVVLGLLAWGIVAGIRALYRATSDIRAEATPSATEERPAAGVPNAAASTVRTSREPLEVPPLYID